MANTFANIIGAIALGILILWGILEVKAVYDKENEEERIFKEQWEQHIQKQMKEMDKMNKQNDSLKKKASKPKTNKTK
jgi:riboflavin synthase